MKIFNNIQFTDDDIDINDDTNSDEKDYQDLIDETELEEEEQQIDDEINAILNLF
jgi:hypothetical protein